ncbi:polyketide cyclase [Streptomyces platensis]|uniref:Polyketide cyclase n=1 Tax=Streptomyces platensis TaxID=58346 RepID=A0AAE6TLE4_STRPT|nr:SRPBCC family protein [Streptomyces platensis]OSY44332.1 Polyketide cyclase / dehydrase and lipid transport [Streptomyces platensis]QEV51497.1 polyketide cyclase [Streptomyces platensis]
MPDWSRRLHRYRFRSVWLLNASPTVVYAVLERAEAYPQWWPQVREVTPLDDRSGTARFRSLLPYDLTVVASERVRDPGAGVLEMTMRGDLAGWARWTVVPGAGGTRAVFEQDVEVCKPLLRRFALLGRPLFLVNHALMMRSGRRGLAAWLARG